jgi:hypothetical protein
MEITQDVKESMSRLSKLNLDFLEFVQKKPACLDRSNFKLLELHDELFVLQPWPTFIDREHQNHFKMVNSKLWGLVRAIPRRVFGYDLEKMSQFYEEPLETIAFRLAGVDDSHLENLTGRIDFILSPSGLKCVECNFSAILGGWQVPIWESLYLNTPLIAQFFKEYGVKPHNGNLITDFWEQLVHSAPEEMLKKDGQWNTAITFKGFEDSKSPVQNYFNTLYKNILKQRGSSLQGRVHMCDFPHLEIVDGNVYLKGEKIHHLVELYNGRIPNEIVEVFKAGNIRLVNGPVSRLLGNKMNLALLSDHDAVTVFDDEEKEFIDRYVPWTRKIMPGSTRFEGKTIDLLEYICSNRKGLVLKPGGSYGGKGVCVGIKATDQQWQESVETALREKNWVVQEYIETVPGLYQAGDSGYSIHDMSWGFFMFGPRYAGLWIRVMPREGSKGVINCHQGASVSVVFIV